MLWLAISLLTPDSQRKVYAFDTWFLPEPTTCVPLSKSSVLQQSDLFTIFMQV